MTGIIILLGSPNSHTGELSSIAKERNHKAFEEYKRHPGYKLLLTGGFGEHFNTAKFPHAHYAKHYLLQLGVPETDFLDFALSSNTVEDARLVKPIVEDFPGKALIVVTSDFHLERAKIIFDSVFPDRTIEYSTSLTALPSNQLEKLKSHELRAINRFRQRNLPNSQEAKVKHPPETFL